MTEGMKKSVANMHAMVDEVNTNFSTENYTNVRRSESLALGVALECYRRFPRLRQLMRNEMAQIDSAEGSSADSQKAEKSTRAVETTTDKEDFAKVPTIRAPDNFPEGSFVHRAIVANRSISDIYDALNAKSSRQIVERISERLRKYESRINNYGAVAFHVPGVGNHLLLLYSDYGQMAMAKAIRERPEWTASEKFTYYTSAANIDPTTIDFNLVYKCIYNIVFGYSIYRYNDLDAETQRPPSPKADASGAKEADAPKPDAGEAAVPDAPKLAEAKAQGGEDATK